ncbi:MAG: hypothetical protein QME78_07115 [Thermodesulfobacteriota bacterium]|nr:hypothetical protein [Thermodesulfobacteriota bacterium]
MKKMFSDWIVIILIILFFAIPVYALAVTEQVNSWPKCPTAFVYQLFK